MALQARWQTPMAAPHAGAIILRSAPATGLEHAEVPAPPARASRTACAAMALMNARDKLAIVR